MSDQRLKEDFKALAAKVEKHTSAIRKWRLNNLKENRKIVKKRII